MAEERVLYEMSSVGEDTWLHHDAKNRQHEAGFGELSAEVVAGLKPLGLTDARTIVETLTRGLVDAGHEATDEGDDAEALVAFMKTKGQAKFLYLVAREPGVVLVRAQYRDINSGKRELFFELGARNSELGTADDKELGTRSAERGAESAEPPDEEPVAEDRNQGHFLDSVTLQQTIFPHQGHGDVPTTAEVEVAELESPADTDDVQGVVTRSRHTVLELEQLYATMDTMAQKHELLVSRMETLAQRADKLDEFFTQQRENDEAIQVLQDLDYVKIITDYLAEEARGQQRRLQDLRGEQLFPLREAVEGLDREGHLGGEEADALRRRLDALERTDEDEPEEPGKLDLLGLIVGNLELRGRLQEQGRGPRPGDLEGLALRACDAVFTCRGDLDEAAAHLKVLCDAAEVRWIEPAPGDEFDSRRHEVVGTEASDRPPRTVARVKALGFLAGDRLVEKARVVLSD